MSKNPDEQEMPSAKDVQELVDQMAAMAPELARGYKKLYDAFVEAGFEDEQALIITMHALKPS